MTEALGTISSAPLWIDDAGSTSVMEIGAKARRLKRDKGLSLLVVDYLQLITGRGRFNSRQEEVASISRGLKGLAKELQIPVLVLSQLTRAPEREERGPQLSDLRESGAIDRTPTLSCSSTARTGARWISRRKNVTRRKSSSPSSATAPPTK